MADSITLEDVRRYRAEPGDVIVYRMRRQVSRDVCQRIREIHRQTFGTEVRALILDSDADLDVVNAGAVADDHHG